MTDNQLGISQRREILEPKDSTGNAFPIARLDMMRLILLGVAKTLCLACCEVALLSSGK
ncbi:MAG: hypothetical protein KC777_11605 [Cyanobacteria bacterium HKST-UBA02]|nr:hypothetical protein [Cyanobacteria bacterium HKST-UBA02]